jgi:pyruvate kinase
MLTRRTRIVATIGPASQTPEILGRLVEAGMNVARLNFSHGTHASHAEVITALRSVSDQVGVLQDLQGPRIRIGVLGSPTPVILQSGARFVLTTRPVPGDANAVSVTYPALPRDVRPGMTILIDDGLLQLLVKDAGETDIVTEVLIGGPLKAQKGINVPEASISAGALTDKDRDDIAFGVAQGVDFFALSFVRCAADIREARSVIHRCGGDQPIIAKIERREAMVNLEEIMQEADGIMVARGDLAVETSNGDVPILQKRLIAMSNSHAKIDITATQMLQSMVDNPRPTRAEVCDVANAVFDGTDAVMLSAETAAGKYPVESVTTMAEIAVRAEENLPLFGRVTPPAVNTGLTAEEATARAACVAAQELGAKGIAVLTASGRSAVRTSQRRPNAPIFAFTPEPKALRRLSLVWGAIPLLAPNPPSVEMAVKMVESKLISEGLAQRGDTIVLTAGSSMLPGATNMMRILKLGDTQE